MPVGATSEVTTPLHFPSRHQIIKQLKLQKKRDRRCLRVNNWRDEGNPAHFFKIAANVS